MKESPFKTIGVKLEDGEKMAKFAKPFLKPGSGTLTSLAPVIGIVLVFAVFSLLSPNFRSYDNAENIVKQMAIPLVTGIGGTFVILMGCIDLSVGGIIVITGVVSAALLPAVGPHFALAIGIILGMICGAVNGYVYTFLRIPSFVATLAMMMIGNGLALFISKARPIQVRVDAYRFPAVGTVFGIPLIWVIAAGLFILAFIWMRYSRTGRYAFAIGGREEVAVLSAVPVRKTKFVVFTLAGTLYGLAGILQNGRLGAATIASGMGTELTTIASVVIGGTALTGGVGGVHRTILGVAIMTALANGLNVVGVSTYNQMIIKGLVLMAAVAATLDRSKVPIIK